MVRIFTTKDISRPFRSIMVMLIIFSSLMSSILRSSCSETAGLAGVAVGLRNADYSTFVGWFFHLEIFNQWFLKFY